MSAALMTIELKGLRFFANHGWHEEEWKTGNEFEVHITASFIPDAVIYSIDATVSYVDVYETAKSIFEETEKLLETVAIKISNKLHEQYPQLTEIKISITKLAAPIIGFKGTVGITYTKFF